MSQPSEDRKTLDRIANYRLLRSFAFGALVFLLYRFMGSEMGVPASTSAWAPLFAAAAGYVGIGTDKGDEFRTLRIAGGMFLIFLALDAAGTVLAADAKPYDWQLTKLAALVLAPLPVASIALYALRRWLNDPEYLL